ncbi:MAG TPA: helix-turn-helix domain-containing protein [Solirubrobacterales bacterium]|nr:helix-turn-helix domain-containing protein [Solirubrobacterales bacterium]
MGNRELANLRPEIRRSWERSLMCGLDPGAVIDLPYEPELGAEERFLRAAGPVLGHVGGFLDGARTTAVLTDPRGRVLLRNCPDSELARVLDRGQSVPGFAWGEEFAGTTALSLAIEEHLPAMVSGGEHFLEALRHLTCAAAPIVHPISQRLVGVIDVTSETGSASAHMMPVVLQAAQAIQERLYGEASTVERVLLSYFLGAANRSGRPIVVLGERVELSTPPAARLLDVDDRTLLWEHAAELIDGTVPASKTLTLSDGRELQATFTPIHDDERGVGVAVEIVAEPAPVGGVLAGAAPASPARAAAPSAATASFLGRSASAQYLREQAEAIRGELMPVLVSGEPGVGKLSLARCLTGDGMDSVLFDAATTSVDGEAGLIREVANVAKTPGKTVIVRRIGCLSAEAVQMLIGLAASAEENESRLVATATAASELAERNPAAELVESFGLRLDLPPLRERADDIVDLVPHFVRRRGATARVAPAAIQALMRYDWPGNARELDSLVRALLTRKRTTDIVLADLPPVYQQGSRRLRRIEQIERAAIVRALIEANGNKTQAAELLEIGRATLYRKIRAYGLDLELTTR